MSPTLPLTTDTFLPYMRDVLRCEQSLTELNLMWRLIESSAKMNCAREAAPILPTIAATREGFRALENELVASLVQEKVRSANAEIGTKAQYVIDIVVRNLYERTADVGFLAIDDSLCRFVAGLAGDPRQIAARLAAYRDKYTVYDEILLFDTQGRVLAQADQARPLARSDDPLIAQTLASGGYLETFRHSSLRPHQRQSLIYSRRMLDPDSGAVVGVLCLCFNFAQEMDGIFATHRDPQQRSIMLLTSADGVVLASADPAWIGVGGVVPANRDGDARALLFGGRQYLVRTFGAAGYQGYPGPPGWQGQVMIPLEVAFIGGGAGPVATLAPELAQGLLGHAQAFCPPLHDILGAADTIRRVVWNGQVMTAGQSGDLSRLKQILDQINETGQRSDELFAESIAELYETAMAARLRSAELLAQLLVDLLDRNLYERANDCRWWALAPELARALAEPERDWESLAALNGILDFINSLYTVYTRIVVYDLDGRIVAASREGPGASLVGERIDAAVLAQVRALPGPQDYAVTPFTPSPLYEGRPTYVYHAAIRDPQQDDAVVGGIGIVFDSEVELAAMLAGGQGERAGLACLLVERSGKVIASTDPARPVGGQVQLEPELLALENGSGVARIVVHDGHYAIMTVKAGAGYREFKRSDGYRADVLAVVFDLLGAVRGAADLVTPTQHALRARPPGRAGQEFATFFLNGALYALPAEHVQQALPASQLAPLSMGGRPERVGVVALPQAGSRAFVAVFDLSYLLSGLAGRVKDDSQLIVLRRGEQSLGLLVGALHAVPQFDQADIVPTPFAGGSNGMLVPRLIMANDGDVLIQVVDTDALFKLIFETLPAPTPRPAGWSLPDTASSE